MNEHRIHPIFMMLDRVEQNFKIYAQAVCQQHTSICWYLRTARIKMAEEEPEFDFGSKKKSKKKGEESRSR